MKYSSHGLPRVREVRGAAQVSELKLQRRAAALEVSEVRERQSAAEASAAREKLEEALVRTDERASLAVREAEVSFILYTLYWSALTSEPPSRCGRRR